MSETSIQDLEVLVHRILAFAGHELSEYDTEIKLLIPILYYLGWSESGDAIIIRQAATTSAASKGPRRIPDLRLQLHGTCVAMIETKRLSQPIFSTEGPAASFDHLAELTEAGRKGLDQVLRYALDDGVPLVWLSNGFQHLIAKVFTPSIPLRERILFSCLDPSDLLRSYSRLAYLRPDKIHTLTEALPEPRTTERLPTSGILFKGLAETIYAASRSHLGEISDDINESSSDSDLPIRKYSRRIHIERPVYTEIADRFLRSSSTVLIFTGDAGCGKTSILCELFESLSRKAECPTLFIDAGALSTGLFEHLEYVLSVFSHVSGGRQRLKEALRSVDSHAVSVNQFLRTVTHSLDPGADLLSLFDEFENVSGTEFRRDFVLILRWLGRQLMDSDAYTLLDSVAVCLDNFSLVSQLIWRLAKDPLRFASQDKNKILQPLVGATEQIALMIKERPVAKGALTEPLLSIVAKIEARPQWVFDFVRSRPWIVDAKKRGRVQFSSLMAALMKLDNTEFPSVQSISEGTIIANCLGRALLSLEANKQQLQIESDDENRAVRKFLITTRSPRLVILIDAINEHIDPKRLRRELEELISLCSEHLAKIVVTCRLPDLHLFFDRGGTALRHSYHEGSSNIHNVQAFSQKELAQAEEKYRAAYSIRGGLGPALASVCSTPLMLRFLCEAFAGGAIPEDDIRNIDIFERYWERKVKSGPYAKDKEDMVLRLASLSAGAAAKDSPLPLEDARRRLGSFSLDEGGPFRSLLGEGVIIYLSPDEARRPGIRFTYEAFHEYVLARIALRRLEDDPSGVSRKLLKEAKASRLARGVLEYVAMALERSNPDAAAVFLESLMAKGFHELCIAALAKAQDMRPFTKVFPFAWLSSGDAQCEMLIRTLARHADRDSNESVGSAFAWVLRNPRSVDAVSDLAWQVACSEPPWLERLPAEEFAVTLGYKRIWRITEHLNPQEKLISVVQRTSIWRKIARIREFARGNCHPDELDWFSQFQSRIDKKQTRRKILAGHLFRLVSRLLGVSVGQPSSLTCFDSDGSLLWLSHDVLLKSSWEAGFMSISDYLPFLTAISEVSGMIASVERILEWKSYADKLRRIILAYVLSELGLRLTEREDSTGSHEPLVDIIEQWRDVLLEISRQAISLDDIRSFVDESAKRHVLFGIMSKLKYLAASDEFFPGTYLSSKKIARY